MCGAMFSILFQEILLGIYLSIREVLGAIISMK